MADLAAYITLPASQQINLETGTVVTSGGDLAWNGSTLTPQGNAVATASGFLQPGYFSDSNAQLQLLLEQGYYNGLYSSKPVTSLGVGTLIGVLDNSGNFSALTITAISPSTLTVQVKTFGTAGSVPAINTIQNNYSYIVPGLPNYGIAPGALFLITGTDLSATAAGPITLQSSMAPGLPTTLNGAAITVTVNGVTTHPAIYYSIATQIAAVLPSSTPTGTGTITVSYHGVPSPAVPITVLASALGLDSFNGTGTGLGVATDLNYNLIGYLHPATPLQNITLWGSGLGADPADSDTTVTSTPHPVNVPLAIYIGGVPTKILYQGASGYPGLNQINVQIPATVPLGCGISVVAVSGSVVSNTVTLPISALGAACADTMLGYTGTQLATEINGAAVGSLTLVQSTNFNPQIGIQTNALGTFQKTATAPGILSLGGCTLSSEAGVAPALAVPAGAGLDAGAVTVSTPLGTVAMTNTPTQAGGASGIYSAPVTNSIFQSSGTTVTFTGSGGADVGAFSGSVVFGAPLTWTNQTGISVVTRANGQLVTWNGGPGNSYVAISGSSYSGTATAAFTCYAPVAAGQFTVPAYILQALPAQGGGAATFQVANMTLPVAFTAQGLNGGSLSVGVSTVANVSYQ